MKGKRIMAVVAHPDDLELTGAGTVVRWVREGAEAILVVATDGARGGKIEGSDEPNMAAERRREQLDAAGVMGIRETVFLGFPDGELNDDETLRGSLVEQLRRHRPDVAMVMDPLTVIYRNYYVNHRDHRMLGMAMLDALYPEASNAAYFPSQIEDGLEPHKVPELLLAQTDQPNYWVDVSDTLETRFQALGRHRSQTRLWPEDGEAVIRQQREVASLLGVEHGMTYAEAFRRVVPNPLS
jgi:LmbE family N-acetylglucosaminyl deacetylase